MKENYIIANFGEIFLKGKNAFLFERRLLENLKKRMPKNMEGVKIEKKDSGSFCISLPEDLGEEDILRLEGVVGNTFGFVNYYRAVLVGSEIDKIKEAAIFLAEKELGKRKVETFGIRAERVSKEGPYGSVELGREVGSAVWGAIKKDVNLTSPDLWVWIKLKKDYTVLYSSKKKAVGGLPVGTSAKAVALFSGGIDSPVAAYLGMKRGLEVVAVHFHSLPKTDQRSIDKVKSLVKEVSRFGGKMKLYLVPIVPVQMDIVKSAKRNLSIVLQRRAFMKIANLIAEEEGAKAIITGDSLGQVASQTVENMTTASEASERLIVRPLVCMDKDEIKEVAERIGTLKISELPHEDACSLFVPPKPETKSKIEYVLPEEAKLNVDLIQEAVDAAEIVEIG